MTHLTCTAKTVRYIGFVTYVALDALEISLSD
jgi:hypothetical protein